MKKLHLFSVFPLEIAATYSYRSKQFNPTISLQTSKASTMKNRTYLQ